MGGTRRTKQQSAEMEQTLVLPLVSMLDSTARLESHLSTHHILLGVIVIIQCQVASRTSAVCSTSAPALPPGVLHVCSFWLRASSSLFSCLLPPCQMFIVNESLFSYHRTIFSDHLMWTPTNQHRYGKLCHILNPRRVWVEKATSHGLM